MKEEVAAAGIFVGSREIDDSIPVNPHQQAISFRHNFQRVPNVRLERLHPGRTRQSGAQERLAGLPGPEGTGGSFVRALPCNET